MDENVNTNENFDETQKQQWFQRKRKQQFYKLIQTFYNIANLSGFRIEGHIKILDLKTGKWYE